MNTATGKNKPRLIEGVDVLKLAIGPEEAFVLSRIDGRSDEQEIALATGLTDERVQSALRRLAALGAILYTANSTEFEITRQQAGAFNASPLVRDPVSFQVVEEPHRATDVGLEPSVLPGDSKKLDEDVELDLAKQRLILDKFNQIDSLNYYEALGIQPDADRKAVKTAYYELVAAIHPDKYFGKNLGHFRAKMEKCFEHITQAYEVLSRQTTREEYDAYLQSQQQVMDLQRALDMRVTPEELDHLEMELMRLAESVSSSSPPRSRDSLSLPISTPPETRTNFRVLTEQERRQALANALRRSPSASRQSLSPVTANVASPKSDSKIPNDGLKHLYESKIQRARQAKLSAHLQAAQEALNRNDPVSACNSLRIAQQLAPDDTAIRTHFDAVQGQANSVLAVRFLEQAKYEERHESYEAASRNYARAAESQPSVELWERAARCGLKGKSDLRMVAEMTRKAIEKCPQRADLHTLLAEVYLEAQLNASAAAELERAARLDPKDDSIRELRRRLERAGN